MPPETFPAYAPEDQCAGCGKTRQDHDQKGMGCFALGLIAATVPLSPPLLAASFRESFCEHHVRMLPEALIEGAEVLGLGIRITDAPTARPEHMAAAMLMAIRRAVANLEKESTITHHKTRPGTVS